MHAAPRPAQRVKRKMSVLVNGTSMLQSAHESVNCVPVSFAVNSECQWPVTQTYANLIAIRVTVQFETMRLDGTIQFTAARASDERIKGRFH